MAETAGKVYPVHNNVFKFGTKGMDSVDGDMAMPKDLENFSPSIDGTVEEWYAMDAGGWAKSAMTGKKLSFSFKGKRSRGRCRKRLYCGSCLEVWSGCYDKI